MPTGGGDLEGEGACRERSGPWLRWGELGEEEHPELVLGVQGHPRRPLELPGGGGESAGL